LRENRSWIHGYSYFKKEGKYLWGKYVKPDLKELQEDKTFYKTVLSYGEEEILSDSKEAMISPSFPIELILKFRSGMFNCPLDCLKETLKYYAWRQCETAILDYGLDTAIQEKIVNPSKSSWCNQCGECCVGLAGHISLTKNDEERIVNFYKRNFDRSVARYDPEAWEDSCKESLKFLTQCVDFVEFDPFWMDVGEREKICLVACPFLERLDSKRSLCIIDPIKPEACRNYNQEHCQKEKVEYHKQAS